MKSIKQQYIIDAPIEKVWNAFVTPSEIERWGGGPAKMDDKLGTKFKLWGGDIYGSNTKIIKGKLLEQDWYGGDWDEPSKLRFELSEKAGKTHVNLFQENIPDDEVADIDDGWKSYYMGPLKEYLEK